MVSVATIEITPLAGITISARVPIAAPAELKKSILATCVPAEELPIAMSVDQFPPNTTCGKTTSPIAPMELVVGTGELVTVAGKEKLAVAGVCTGAGTTPISNPAAVLLGQTEGAITPANPSEEVVTVAGVVGTLETATGVAGTG